MKAKIYVPDIECDSCVKIITKTLNKKENINKFSVTKTDVEVDFNENKITLDEIKKIINQKGYRTFDELYRRKTIRERLKEFKKNKKKYVLEYKMLRYITYTFLIFILLEIGFIFLQDKYSNPLFFERYAIWLFYLTVAVVSVAGVIWHYRSYKTTFTCMLGMMIGMTIGMQSGMMIGAIIGATNGFFWGALIGMLLASTVGIMTGVCCGIMGVMEGVMAGIMGGTMGAMITVMMFTEHIYWFMPFYMGLNLIALFGMVFMIFEEVVEDNENIITRKISFTRFFTVTLIVLIGLTTVIVLAPPSIFMM